MSKKLDSSKYGYVGEYIKDNTKKGARIDITSPIFTIYAYQQLSDVLNESEKVRFLFNEPTFIEKLEVGQKIIKEFELSKKERERSVSEFPFEISLKNNLDQNYVANKVYRFINEKMEVKSAKQVSNITTRNIYIKQPNDSFLITGSGLSFSVEGLGYTKKMKWDFNTVNDEQELLKDYETFFDEIWHNSELVEDVKEALLDYVQNLYKENSPELVYYLTLYHLFNEKLINMDDMAKIKQGTNIANSKIWQSLYNFQHDAVVGAIKKLELYNGCIIADSVGLGKTYEALAVIKYYELRNHRVLVLSPKKLRSNWTSFKQNTMTNPFVNDRFNYDVLNHTDLSRESGKSGDIDLSRINWGNYDLLVIDESHNFRNNPPVKNRKTRYQKLMEDIIKSGVKTKVLMLSATPVNNRLADLKNQIMFITENNDKAFKDNIGLESIDNTLRKAQRSFVEWSRLDRKSQTVENLLPTLDFDFFNLLNTITIARSRKHITTFYDTKDIGKFPNRLSPISIKTDIDLKNEFPALSEINSMIAQLNLAIYAPMLYILSNRRDYYEELYKQTVKEGKSQFKQSDREIALINLMRINLLKRLESSIISFKLTVERILKQVNDMLSMVDTDDEYTLDEENIIDDAEFDEDDASELELGTKIKVKLSDIDKIKLKEDLLQDKEKLVKLLDASNKVTVSDDAKLSRLKEQIRQKILNPINENNKKIIVFTAFADTANYLYIHLEKWIYSEFNLHTALVVGSNGTKSNLKGIKSDFENILIHFSPKSNKINVEKEIDILIATDVISEGQNLQDCDYLINYDIHWNPVRIIQRFGRIDRLGSTNKHIQLVNFWANIDLDEYIKLESRVRTRMAMVDLSATGEDDLLNPVSKDLKYRKEQLEQLQNEVVDIEDLQGGISLTDLTLDDFMMALDQYMKEYPGLLESYPTGVYGITDIDDRLKNEALPGVIFCLKQIHFNENEKNENSLYPYHLVYVKQDDTIHVKANNPKKILDIYKAICSGKKEVVESLVKEFNKETKNSNDMSKYTHLLEKAIYDINGYSEEKGIKSIFGFGESSLDKDKISGIDDFELISFFGD